MELTAWRDETFGSERWNFQHGEMELSAWRDGTFKKERCSCRAAERTETCNKDSSFRRSSRLSRISGKIFNLEENNEKRTFSLLSLPLCLPSHLYNKQTTVASARRFPSDSGAFADWLASSSSSTTNRGDDLCLGFSGGGGGPTSVRHQQQQQQIITDIGVVGLRDVFLVAPATSFHPTSQHYHTHTHTHNHQDPPSALFSQDLWQQQQQQQNQNPNPNLFLRRQPEIFSAASGSAGGGGVTCQDCGNQAKKDCPHRRCRTCCKSRGFDCSTHVRSTWVPAARRRERLQTSGGFPSGSSGTKKARVSQTGVANSHTSTSNTTRSLDTSSSQQDARFRENLPGHVRAPAVFKCVQVTSIEDDGEDEFAYQAMVKIGGHVFKGFLYDQGADENNNNESIPNISELHLGGRAPGAATAVDLSGLLGGTNYGHPIN